MSDKVRAAIYARISMDSTGDELGVARQLDLARDLITSRGWVEVGAYPDNSISAHSGKHRPGYTALCDAVRRGEVDRVVCYHLSRLWRNRGERAAGIDLFRDARVSIASVRGSDMDMQSAAGRTMVGLLGEFDTMESDVKSERIQDQKRQRAEAGRYQGSSSRPFGYAITHDRPAVDPDTGRKTDRRVTGIAPHPVEAGIVVECAARVLGGESLSAVTRDLNQRGVTSTVGKPFRAEALRRILSSALISGRKEIANPGGERTRPLLGEILTDGVGDAVRVVAAPARDGRPAEYLRPIISVEDSDRLRRLLSAPERRTNTVQARKTLLTGILRCGKCCSPMVSRPARGRPRYVCNDSPGRPGCGGTQVDRTKTDDLIRGQVIALLTENGPAMVERLRRESGADPDLIEHVKADEDELEALAQDLGNQEISRAEWRAARAPIAARLNANRARLDAQPTGQDLSALTKFVGSETTPVERAAGMVERWEAMTDAQRRPVVTATVEKIVVGAPTVLGRFDPFRFRIDWQGHAATNG